MKPQVNCCQSHCKSVSTNNTGSHSINGYWSHGNQFPHISWATTASTATTHTGNQCPHITMETTASRAISFTGNEGPHNTTATTGQLLSCPLKISVHIYQGKPQVTNYQSHCISVSTYNKGNQTSTSISPLEIRVHILQRHPQQHQLATPLEISVHI